MVQAVKDPMKSKGARLTTEISLPGRFLVYVPNGEGSGVSRRLEDAERTRLKEIVRKLDPKGGGIIVRTAAEGASAEDIERDLVFLQRLWKTIQAKAKTATAPTLVYEEAELPLRIVRDLFAGDFVGAQIDDDRTHRRIVSYLKKTSPHMVERVHRYREKAPLFEASGVDAEIRSTLDRRVDLPSGGYLVFDYAEAFTVIDVNTGRFVGSRGKSAQGRLEDTIVKNNLEAVNEVVRQLRLRDIGGIIVIDFIDMANPKNRETVEEALRSELERDRTKTYVVEISPLGLVEMTRQNVTDGPREILTNRCPVCSGDGIVVSDATHALEVERKLRAIAKGSRVQAFKVAVHPRVLALLAGPGGTRLEALESVARRRFFLVPTSSNGHVHSRPLRRRSARGSSRCSARPRLSPRERRSSSSSSRSGSTTRRPVSASSTATTRSSSPERRSSSGRRSRRASDERSKVSRTRRWPKARRSRRRRSRSRRKPRSPRAPSRSKKDTDAAPELEASIEPTSPADDDELVVEDPSWLTTGGAGRGDEPTERRRRSERVAERAVAVVARSPQRGGVRRRRRDHRTIPATVVPRSRESTCLRPISRSPRWRLKPLPSRSRPTVPDDEAPAAEVALGPDGQPKRKRSRRGSRGGKKRRKPAAANGDAEGSVSDEPAADEPAAEAQSPEEAVGDGEPPAYVPMSEWIDDFDPRSRA